MFSDIIFSFSTTFKVQFQNSKSTLFGVGNNKYDHKVDMGNMFADTVNGHKATLALEWQ